MQRSFLQGRFSAKPGTHSQEHTLVAAHVAITSCRLGDILQWEVTHVE
jgi:hypothetical protein